MNRFVRRRLNVVGVVGVVDKKVDVDVDELSVNYSGQPLISQPG